MNLMTLRKHLSAALLLTLFCSASAMAAATVSVTASGETSFAIQGAGMDGVAGISLDITYETPSLSSPTVTQGALVSGSMFAANTTRPGSIKIAIISSTPFSGSGLIATISFATKSGTAGITSTRVSMIDSNGAEVAATAAVNGTSGSSTTTLSNSPGVPFSQTVPTIQNQTTPSGQSGSTVTATSLGTVTLPGDPQQPATVQQQPPAPAPPGYTAEPPAPRTPERPQPSVESAAELKSEATPQYVVYKDTSYRFKQNDGSKKLAAAIALFDKKIAQTIQQSPAVVISNGLDKAIVTIDVPATVKSSPNFAVNGGTIVSLQQDTQQKSRWRVEVLPETGSLKVTVTIIAGNDEFEYPLTVAPPLKTALTLDENGWNTFTAEVGTAKAPMHDLNHDGIRDYIDEYIFAANILAKKAAPIKPYPTAPPLKPLPVSPPKTGK